MVTKNLEKSPSQIHIYVVYLEKSGGLFQEGRPMKREEKSLRFQGVFLARDLGQMRGADIKVFFTLIKFKCVCVKC